MCYSKIKYIHPDCVRFFNDEKTNSLSVKLDCKVYNHVKVYRTSPISYPTKYISLRVGTSSSEETEIGIIRDPDSLPLESRALIERELDKRYFIHIITKIHSIKEEFSFLYWDVDTDKGRKEFVVASRAHHRITEYGENGRIILDLDWNRYQIPDLRDLDEQSRRLFYRYIYW